MKKLRTISCVRKFKRSALKLELKLETIWFNGRRTLNNLHSIKNNLECSTANWLEMSRETSNNKEKRVREYKKVCYTVNELYFQYDLNYLGLYFKIIT